MLCARGEEIRLCFDTIAKDIGINQLNMKCVNLRMCILYIQYHIRNVDMCPRICRDCVYQRAPGD